MVTADLGLELIILQADERSFFFQSEKNPRVVRPAENFTLSEWRNFNILQSGAGQEDSTGGVAGHQALSQLETVGAENAWQVRRSINILSAG